MDEGSFKLYVIVFTDATAVVTFNQNWQIVSECFIDFPVNLNNVRFFVNDPLEDSDSDDEDWLER